MLVEFLFVFCCFFYIKIKRERGADVAYITSHRNSSIRIQDMSICCYNKKFLHIKRSITCHSSLYIIICEHQLIVTVVESRSVVEAIVSFIHTKDQINSFFLLFHHQLYIVQYLGSLFVLNRTFFFLFKQKLKIHFMRYDVHC